MGWIQKNSTYYSVNCVRNYSIQGKAIKQLLEPIYLTGHVLLKYINYTDSFLRYPWDHACKKLLASLSASYLFPWEVGLLG